MGRKAPGLGKKLSQVLEETQETGGNTGRGKPAPTTGPPPGGLRSLFPSRDASWEDTTGDLDPYFVGPASEYYQGPALSTRVRAHQFIPTESQQNSWIMDNPVHGAQVMPIIEGYIYVRWRNNGKLTRYGPCTLSDYRSFRESHSKGRSVRWLESFPFQNNWPDEQGLLI